MAIKSVSIRMEEEMLRKLNYVADYEGRSINSHVLVLIRQSIRAFEDAHGEISTPIDPGRKCKAAAKIKLPERFVSQAKILLDKYPMGVYSEDTQMGYLKWRVQHGKARLLSLFRAAQGAQPGGI